MESFERVLDKLVMKSGLEKEVLIEKIRKKQEEFGGLVSMIGAAYIVASELGCDLLMEESHITKIRDIKNAGRRVDVIGRVLKIYEPKEFAREDGTKGKVASIVIADETGTARVVLWDDHVRYVEEGKLVKDLPIKIKNALTKKGINNTVELHLTKRSKIITNLEEGKKIPHVSDLIYKIGELESGMLEVDVIGRVLKIYEPKEFAREDGTKGKVASIVIADETGTARVVLWDDKVNHVKNINVGDAVKISSAYVKEGYFDIELHLSKMGKIKKVEADLPPVEELVLNKNRVAIADLKEGERNKEIRGTIVKLFEREILFSFCPNCGKRIDNVCSTCGKVDPEYLLVINAVIDDGTSNIRAIFFRDAAEKLLGVKASEVAKYVKEGKSSLELLLLRKDEILGKEIIVSGKVRYNDVIDDTEFVVQEIREPQIEEEINILIKELEECKGK